MQYSYPFIAQKIVTQGWNVWAPWFYGKNWGFRHKGVDFGAHEGTPVLSISDGIVLKAEYDGAWGYHVVIKHENNIESWYAHLVTPSVKEGKIIKERHVIGYVGSTGKSTGNHLHLGVKENGRWRDPFAYIPWRPIDYPNIIYDILGLMYTKNPEKIAKVYITDKKEKGLEAGTYLVRNESTYHFVRVTKEGSPAFQCNLAQAHAFNTAMVKYHATADDILEYKEGDPL